MNAATLTGPTQAAQIFPKLGIIDPVRGNSFVMLSTGYAILANMVTEPKAPEPGTDFGAGGVAGDEVTLTLNLAVPPGANRLSLQYNFLSSESPDFIGSAYNDIFSIQLNDGVTITDHTLASVNSSTFFEASDSRAEGSGYDIYTDDPVDVDLIFGAQGLPDAGLTDFQTFNVPVVAGSALTVKLRIADAGDGILDSAVLIDALEFVGAETIDPVPALIQDDGSLVSDVDKLATEGKHVRGAVADGVTEVLLRVRTPTPGDTTFTILGAGGLADGALSTVGGNQQATSVTPSTVSAAGEEYALAVYRAPKDFGADGAERPIKIGVSFAPAGGGAPVPSQVEMQLRRPPVVLAHGPWSKSIDWQGLGIVNDPSFDITYAEHTYGCDTELRIQPKPIEQLPCPYLPPPAGQGELKCSADRSNKIGQATHEAIFNAQRLGFAATQADVVAHGAGGVYVRKYISSHTYKTATNRQHGDVNRLITMNTPHFGSPVAKKFVDKRNATLADQAEFLCKTREMEKTPIDLGDIDDLTPQSSNLAATAVPAHAVVGTGGSAPITGQILARKLTPRNQLYTTSGAIPLAATFGVGVDHDLFVSVPSQKGGLADLATSPFALINGPSQTDSAFFNSMKDARISPRITQLLKSPIAAPLYAEFAASPVPPPLLSAFVREASAPSALPPNASLRIVSPTSGTHVVAGSNITVQVLPQNGFVPAGVVAMTPDSSAESNTPPFTMTLHIPADALGQIPLLAIGFDANDEMVFSNDVVLVATTQATVSSVSILTQDPVLFGLGSTRQLAVTGKYNDGVTRDITSAASGTTYLSSNPAIAQVTPYGSVIAVGAGIATIVAQNGSVQDSITVTVKGNASPHAVGSGDVSLACVAPGAQVPVDLDATGSFDPDGDLLTFSWYKGNVLLATGATPTIGLGAGVHAIELRVADGQGGSASAIVTISIAADTAPPSIALLGASPGLVECGASYVDPGATAQDVCAGDLTAAIVAQSNVDPGAPGSYAVSYQVTDEVGLTATAQRSVTVQDTTAPTLACPAPAVAECTGSGQAVVDPGDAAVADACSAPAVTNPGPSSYPLGTTQIGYTAVDPSGNQSSCQTSVTVQDTIAPSIACPAPTVAECTGGGQAVVDPGDAAVIEACAAGSVTDPGPGIYSLGATQIGYTAVDGVGHVASCQTSVTVQDTLAPSISCPAPVVAECTGAAGAQVTPAAATASDVCTGVTVSGPAASTYPLGATPVTYTATDAAGHAASCSSSIQVVDTTPPMVEATSPAPVWPANHAYRTIDILSACNIAVQDACGGVLAPSAYQAAITCVTSDEEDDAPGYDDSNTIKDIVILDSHRVRLRAERMQNGDGRVYRINFRVRDAAGNTQDGVCPVLVPAHYCYPGDQKPECEIEDNGVAHSVCAP